MLIEPILALIIIRYLRKKVETKKLFPQWDQLLVTGIGISIALLVIDVTVSKSKPYVMWLDHILMFAIVYLVLSKKEFLAAKSLVYSLLPLMIISFITNVFELANKELFKEWKDYFGGALFFASLSIFVIWLITKKQRTTLENERLKILEIEKENKINTALKAQLEVQVAERTAALTEQKEELIKTLEELKSTQTQLIHAEKMASLGELTAGIAHEIQNPLNFVNNFSEVSTELVDEMNEEIAKGNLKEAKEIANDLKTNLAKINHHGKRADTIVKGMLQHSRTSSGQKEPTSMNELADEFLRLSYHGLRAKDKSFNAKFEMNFDASIGKINIMPQDIGRVILNLITNAFYAVTERKKQHPLGFEPCVKVETRKINDRFALSVMDNGNGIPTNVLEKIFQPFFTTKPSGEGTGLGLSLSYDIVKAHGGELTVESKEGEGATFTISLPML
jgi:two-component system, NtrC family, sensor kinase